MKDPSESRGRQDALDDAAKEAGAPSSATDARVADVAATRTRQASDANGLRRAADALSENQARLRQVGAELRERERELGRTRDLVRDVARSTRELRASRKSRAAAPPATAPAQAPSAKAPPASDPDADTTR